ncbi:MAG: hypothetical protein ACRD0G_16400, partial [Acidimicrobiales bacterium]
ALVAGGEAMRSLEVAMRAGALPPWPPPPAHARPPNPRDHVAGAMAALELLWPTEVYPLYEQGSRHAAGLTQRQAVEEAAARWSAASTVAAANPTAWLGEERTPAEIATVGERNRMVAWPYPKLLTAQLGVDQSAAVLVTSTDHAAALRIPEDRWVYPRGGAVAAEPDDVLARSTFERTAAGDAVLDGALALADLAVEDLDLVELYSCFPCIPRMAAGHLGLDPAVPTTVTGGLTFFGGPANDYMLHAVVAMTRALRDNRGEHGLLYGQGGYATKHHAMTLTRRPADDGYAVDDAGARQASVDAEPRPPFEPAFEGEGTIETFTVPFGRDGTPARAVVVGRRPDGRRFAGDLAPEPAAIAVLTDLDDEPVGRPVRARVVAERQIVELA